MASPDSVSAPSLPEQSGHGPAMVLLVIPIIGCGPGGIVLSWICPVPLHRHGSSNGAPNGQPFSDSSGRKIRRKSLPAERAGFEPARQLSPSTDLANRRFRPLSHLSGCGNLRVFDSAGNGYASGSGAALRAILRTVRLAAAQASA
jgi:hypothetical protein